MLILAMLSFKKYCSQKSRIELSSFLYDLCLDALDCIARMVREQNSTDHGKSVEYTEDAGEHEVEILNCGILLGISWTFELFTRTRAMFCIQGSNQNVESNEQRQIALHSLAGLMVMYVKQCYQMFEG